MRNPVDVLGAVIYKRKPTLSFAFISVAYWDLHRWSLMANLLNRVKGASVIKVRKKIGRGQWKKDGERGGAKGRSRRGRERLYIAALALQTLTTSLFMASKQADKRVTRFPGSSSPNLGKRTTDQSGNQQTRTPASHIPRLSSSEDSRPQPPALLRLNVNPHSSQFSISKRFKEEQRPFSKTGLPWPDYHAVLSEDQAGKVIIAYENKIQHQVVVVREHSSSMTLKADRMKNCAHPNIIDIKGAFHDHTSIFFVYEWIDVSVAEVQAAPCGKFASYQIAAVCKEVSGSLAS